VLRLLRIVQFGVVDHSRLSCLRFDRGLLLAAGRALLTWGPVGTLAALGPFGALGTLPTIRTLRVLRPLGTIGTGLSLRIAVWTTAIGPALTVCAAARRAPAARFA
jgi:hypothetical protein